MSISVALVTKNEEEMLPGCLASVSWADEIVVVDSLSADRTKEIAFQAGAKVFTRPWSGYVDQKNFAMDQCAGPWVLILDADERVTSELASELQALITTCSDVAAFRVPFRMFCLGREIKHGGWGRGYYIHRLIRKGRARYSDKEVHERLIVEGPEKDLKGAILHHPYRDVGQMLMKQDTYSALEALELFKKGHRPVARRDFVLRPLRYWTQRYLFQLGFLDGPQGLILAGMHSVCRLLVMAKLWQIQTRGNQTSPPS